MMSAPLLNWPIVFLVFSSGFTWFTSAILSNSGTIDRLWGFLPAIHTAYFALLPLWPNYKNVPTILVPHIPLGVESVLFETFNPRALLVLILVVIWMVRLSYNAWRRGLFKLGAEDYRWKVIRSSMGKLQYHLFNILWICLGQNFFLFSLSLPVYRVVSSTASTLTIADWILFTVALLDIGLEFVADNQQWTYQNFKSLYLSHKEKGSDASFTPIYQPSTYWPFALIPFTGADVHRGFITKGLWAWSRHPNFLFEQAFWILIAVFPLVSLPLPVENNWKDWFSFLWHFTPSLFQILMFTSSTVITEGISKSKYPAYVVYQRRVGMFLTIPWALLMPGEEKREEDELLWGDGKMD